jgi:DNA-binding transcriptional regulator YhcF (GntR family)
MLDVSDDNPGDAAARLLAEIVVDRRAEIPIGVQLAWAVRCRIADGRLESGSRLPGLRDLAGATGVNVNTIRGVYQRLEHEGLVESHQGTGTFVSANTERASAVGSIAAVAAGEAKSLGVDPRSVAAALYVASSTAVDGKDEALERRRALRAQISTLERTVAELEAGHPEIAAKLPKTRKSGGPRLLDANALEEVRSDLLRRLARMQTSIDERAAEPSTRTIRPAKKAAAPKRSRAAAPTKSRRDAAKPPAGRPATA